MHWRGPSSRMNELAGYEDVLGEVRAELVARVDAAVLAGVDPARLVLDPGLGFAKTAGAQLGAAAPARRAARARVPGAGRSLAQTFPRAAAGRCRRHRRAGPRPRRATAAISALAAAPAPGGCGCTTSRRPWTRWRWPQPGSWVRPRPGSAPASSGDDRPDRAARVDRARPPRRVRPRAARRPGLRRRSHGVAGSRPAAASDELADTLDYGALAEHAAAIIGGEPCNLIEAVAGRIADDVLTDDRVRPSRSCCTSPRPRSRWSSPTSRSYDPRSSPPVPRGCGAR